MPQSPPNPARPSVESLEVIVQAVMAELAVRGQTPELPTGIPALDETIWGLHRNELTVIAARPGEGKTTLAIQIGRHLAEQHKRVLFVSMEMTRHQIAERMLVQMTQADAWNLRIGKGIDELTARMEPLFKANLFDRMNLRIVDKTGYTLPQIQYLVKEIGAPDLLIIDFIQLIRLEGGMQRFDAIAEYLIGLKELAMQHNMAVLVCSQVNREGAKGGIPKLENLKGSGSIEELADCVLMCHWEELGTEERPQGNKYWIIIRKNRYGSPGDKIPVTFDLHHLTYHPVDASVSGWNGKAEEDVVV